MPIIIRKVKKEEETKASPEAATSASSAKGTKERDTVGTSSAPAKSRTSWKMNRTQSGNAGTTNRRETKLSSRKKKESSSSSDSSDSSSSSSSNHSSSSSDDSDDEDTEEEEEEDDDEEEEEEEEEKKKEERRDSIQDGALQNSGRTKNLAGFFSTQSEGSPAPRKKRIELAEAPGTLVLENEPERLEGVVRADDPGEWEKPIEIEKGRAKLIANMLQAKKDEEPKIRRKPIRLEEGVDPVVLGNEPVVLEGVVRSGEPQKTDEDIFKERGRIRNIAERWKRAQEQQQQLQPSDEEEDEPPCDKPKKPAWLLELESAKESGVYETENTPMVRDDVVRADDDEPDVISFQRTRNLRKMWSEIEKEKPDKTKDEGTKEAPNKKQTSNKTQKQEVSSNSETETSSEEEEEEETSSEEDEDEEEVQRSKRLPLTSKEQQKINPQLKGNTFDNSRTGLMGSPSAVRYSLFVNEASLRYAPKE